MRKQYLYWFVALTLLVIFAFVPYAQIETVQSLYKGSLLGFSPSVATLSTIHTIPLLLLEILCLALSVGCLVMSKRRLLQLRLSVLNILLQLGLIGLMLFYAFRIKSGLDSPAILSFRLTAVLPLLSMLLTLMAARGVWKDIIYLKKMSRLR